MKKDFAKLAMLGSRDLTPSMVQEALGGLCILGLYQ